MAQSVEEVIDRLPVYRKLELAVPGRSGNSIDVVVHVVGGVRL